IALAQTKTQVVPQHQAETLIGRLVEAELAFQLGNEFGRQALCAAVFTAAAAAEHLAAAAGDAPGRRGLTFELGDDLLDRPAGQKLGEDEIDQQDAEQRRHDQQQPAKEISPHQASPRPVGPGACLIGPGNRASLILIMPAVSAMRPLPPARRISPGRTTNRRRRAHKLARSRAAQTHPSAQPSARPWSSSVPRSAWRAAPGRAPSPGPPSPRAWWR